MLFPEYEGQKAAAFFRHYLPEDVVEQNERYRAWHADGWLLSTSGNVIDFEYIEVE